MIRVARITKATVLLAFILVPTKGGNKDWREVIVQSVHLHGRQEMADYTVVDETTEYVLRPHSTSFAVRSIAAFGGQAEVYYTIGVVAGDHVQIARSGSGMKLKDLRGKQHDCLIVSSRLLGTPVATAVPDTAATPDASTTNHSVRPAARSGQLQGKISNVFCNGQSCQGNFTGTFAYWNSQVCNAQGSLQAFGPNGQISGEVLCSPDTRFRFNTSVHASEINQWGQVTVATPVELSPIP